jgi:hypothetical protein
MLFPLLSHLDDRTSRTEVFVYFYCDGFGHTQASNRAEEIEDHELTFRVGQQRRHFLRRESRPTLLPWIYPRQTYCCEIPLTVMNGIELLV